MIKGAKYIIETFNKNGFQAYLVGGCVRDMIMGNTPDDYDITTDALPSQIVKLFERTILTGEKHGTVTVRINSQNYEVTTFRIDGEYINNRKPKEVIFTNKLKEDIKRRDFTINSIAYSPDEGYIDYFNGKKDIKDKIIRTVLDPYERFTEDALRILRGIRFSVRFDFKIEENTFKAMGELSHLIKNISVERVVSELKKIFQANPYKSVKILNELNILSLFDIEITDEIMSSLELLKHPSFESVLAILLASSSDYEKILIKLKLSNKQKADIKKTINAIHYDFTDKKSLKLFLKDNDISDIFYNVNDVILAITNNTKNIETFISPIIQNNECYSIKDLAINGNDLIKLGAKNSDIGRILNELLLKVIDNNELNNYEQLIKECRNLI